MNPNFPLLCLDIPTDFRLCQNLMTLMVAWPVAGVNQLQGRMQDAGGGTLLPRGRTPRIGISEHDIRKTVEASGEGKGVLS